MDNINDYGHWDISLVGEFNPDDFFGFIYRIDEKDTGKSYIGRKQLKTKTQKKDYWKYYISSSKEFSLHIQQRGKENFSFFILSLCSGKSQLTYEEEKVQFENDVLRARLENGERKYYNKTIGYRNFNGVEKQTEKSRQKASMSNTGKKRTDEMKKNYSLSKKGIPKSKEHKEKLRQINLGKTYSKETNSKKGKGPDGVKLLWWNNGIKQIRSIQAPDQSWTKGRLFVNNKKSITEEEKEWIINKKPSIKEISNKIGMSKQTIKRILKEENIYIDI